MVQYCVVPLCKSSCKTPGISFHKFPADKELFKTWAVRIRRDERKSRISSSMRVCSRHFLPSDFKEVLSGRKFLKKAAIPSIFSFTSPRKMRQPRRKLNYDKVIEINEDLEDQVSMIPGPADHSSQFEDLHLLAAVCDPSFCLKNIIELKAEVEELKKKNRILEQALSHCKNTILNQQETIKSLSESMEYLSNCNDKVKEECKGLKKQTFNMENIQKSDKLVTFYTGFPSAEVLKVFSDFVVCGDSFNPASSSVKRGKCLKPQDELLLVLSKLKQGFCYIDLAYRLGVTNDCAGIIFQKWVGYLYTRLGSLKIWPHRDIILQHAPSNFKELYPTTIVILDGTEMRLQVPSSLVRQSQSFSNYKSTNTVKGIVGVDPKGGIIFISELYTGSISDKGLLRKCGFFDLLKEKLECGEISRGDGIMVDKGFNISSEVESLGLMLNVPPTASSMQFSTQQVMGTRDVANCRVTVERSIRKIKTYKVLAGTIPITLTPLINQIWTVCCILANFRCQTKC